VSKDSGTVSSVLSIEINTVDVYGVEGSSAVLRFDPFRIFKSSRSESGSTQYKSYFKIFAKNGP
jgi:hypothetical protein